MAHCGGTPRISETIGKPAAIKAGAARGRPRPPQPDRQPQPPRPAGPGRLLPPPARARAGPAGSRPAGPPRPTAEGVGRLGADVVHVVAAGGHRGEHGGVRDRRAVGRPKIAPSSTALIASTTAAGGVGTAQSEGEGHRVGHQDRHRGPGGARGEGHCRPTDTKSSSGSQAEGRLSPSSATRVRAVPSSSQTEPIIQARKSRLTAKASVEPLPRAPPARPRSTADAGVPGRPGPRHRPGPHRLPARQAQAPRPVRATSDARHGHGQRHRQPGPPRFERHAGGRLHVLPGPPTAEAARRGGRAGRWRKARCSARRMAPKSRPENATSGGEGQGQPAVAAVGQRLHEQRIGAGLDAHLGQQRLVERDLIGRPRWTGSRVRPPVRPCCRPGRRASPGRCACGR